MAAEESEDCGTSKFWCPESVRPKGGSCGEGSCKENECGDFDLSKNGQPAMWQGSCAVQIRVVLLVWPWPWLRGHIRPLSSLAVAVARAVAMPLEF